MLERLCIHHYALIDDAEILFHDGLTVLSGETGAGKSIIMGALSLLLGDKADASSIRYGCDSATVSATFSFEEGDPILPLLEAMDIAMEEGELVVSRTVRSNGRSSVSIQGVARTRGELASLATRLVDVSAQRDHQSLFQSAKQREVLDSYAKNGALLASYRTLWEKLGALTREKEETEALLEARGREEDYLSYALDEIEKLSVRRGEDDEIAAEIKVLSSYEAIHEELEACLLSLGGGESGVSALSSLREAARNLSSASRADASLVGLASRLESAGIECRDIWESVRDHFSSMSYSQEKLDRLQSRLSLLQRAKRKYGPTLEDVLRFRDEAKAKLEVASHGEERLARLEKEVSEIREAMMEKGRELTNERKKAAVRLAGETERVLHSLGMERAVFSIRLDAVKPSATGLDEVVFTICANPGLEARAIREVASGGELSRILLSLKAVLDHDDPVGTLVFDEVDSGIGGTVANAVGAELLRLKETHQVLTITHLASIAAMADHHLLVEKRVIEGRTYSSIRAIGGEEREREIARMLSGDNSEVTLAHARQLLKS